MRARTNAHKRKKQTLSAFPAIYHAALSQTAQMLDTVVNTVQIATLLHTLAVVQHANDLLTV